MKLSSDKIISLSQWLDQIKTAKINQQHSLNSSYQLEQETADSIDDDIVLSGMLIW